LSRGRKGETLGQVVERKGNIKSANVTVLPYAKCHTRYRG
jgi:hypothetical protein